MEYKTARRVAKANFEKDNCVKWELYNLPNMMLVASSFESLQDVPLNKKCATLYAVKIIKPDNTTAIYVGSYNQPMGFAIGTGITLDNSNTLGIVVSLKNLWTGGIEKLG